MSDELHPSQLGQKRPEYSIEFLDNTMTDLNPVISPTASYHMNGKLHSLLSALVERSITQKIPLEFFINDRPYRSNFSIKNKKLSPEEALATARDLGASWVEKCKEDNKTLFDRLSAHQINFSFTTACDFYKDHQNIIAVLSKLVNCLINVESIHDLLRYIPRSEDQTLPQDPAQIAFIVAVDKRFKKIKHDEQNNVLCARDEHIKISTIERVLEETIYMLFWQLIGKKHICYPRSEDNDSISVFNVFDVVLNNVHALAAKPSLPSQFAALIEEFSRLAREKGYTCNFQNRLKICDVKYTRPLQLSAKKDTGVPHAAGQLKVPPPHTPPQVIPDASADAAANAAHLSTSVPTPVSSPMAPPPARKAASWPKKAADPTFLGLLAKTAQCTDTPLTAVAADNAVALLEAYQRRMEVQDRRLDRSSGEEQDAISEREQKERQPPRDVAPRANGIFPLVASGDLRPAARPTPAENGHPTGNSHAANGNPSATVVRYGQK